MFGKIREIGGAVARGAKRVAVAACRSAKRTAAVVGGLVVGLIGAHASAGGPPTMDAVEFPIDIASIATAISVAGAAILLSVFTVTIGFRLAKALFRHLSSGVAR